MGCCDEKVGVYSTRMAAIFAHTRHFEQTLSHPRQEVTRTTVDRSPPQYADSMLLLVRRRHVDFVRVTSMSCRRSA